MNKLLFRLLVYLYLLPMLIVGFALSILIFPIFIGTIYAERILDWCVRKFKEDDNG